MVPLWVGTKWDYNGTTQTPQQGMIACGYFVSTLLEQAGFNIDRVALARQASEAMIKNLTNESHISRFSRAPIDQINNDIILSGEGLYIVGLDYHTGLITYDGEKIRMIHSGPIEVNAEEVDADSPVGRSNYVVIGKILSGEMIRKWSSSGWYAGCPEDILRGEN